MNALVDLLCSPKLAVLVFGVLAFLVVARGCEQAPGARPRRT